jgi:hypothetical protein
MYFARPGKTGIETFDAVQRSSCCASSAAECAQDITLVLNGLEFAEWKSVAQERASSGGDTQTIRSTHAQ